MRTKTLAFVLASSLVACQSAVIEGLHASSTGGTSNGGATTSSTGGPVAAPPSCIFSATGAVNVADLAPQPISDFILGPNMFQCGDIASGSSDRLFVYLGADVDLGLGSFPAPYAGSYQWEHCEAGSCSYYENDGSAYPSGGCAVTITLAPAADTPGQPIAGTFSCTSLLGGGSSPNTVAMTGSFSLLTKVVGDPAPTGGTGGAGGSSGGSSSGTGGAGGDGGVEDFCAISVSGAIDIPAADAGRPTSYGGQLMCSDSVLGAEGWLSLDLTKVHGPGSYSLLTGAGYDLSFCAMTGQGCTDDQNFLVPSGAAGCSVEITAAPPVIPTYGELLAGSFSCPSLVDASDPARSVAVSGSFGLIMEPPPH